MIWALLCILVICLIYLFMDWLNYYDPDYYDPEYKVYYHNLINSNKNIFAFDVNDGESCIKALDDIREMIKWAKTLEDKRDRVGYLYWLNFYSGRAHAGVRLAEKNKKLRERMKTIPLPPVKL